MATQPLREVTNADMISSGQIKFKGDNFNIDKKMIIVATLPPREVTCD